MVVAATRTKDNFNYFQWECWANVIRWQENAYRTWDSITRSVRLNRLVTPEIDQSVDHRSEQNKNAHGQSEKNTRSDCVIDFQLFDTCLTFRITHQISFYSRAVSFLFTAVVTIALNENICCSVSSTFIICVISDWMQQWMAFFKNQTLM